MTCWMKREVIEREYQAGKIEEKVYNDLVKQMEEHEKLYHPDKVEKKKQMIMA